MTRSAPTFYAQIAANRRASWGLMLIVTVLLVALAGSAGYALGYGWAGIPFALILAILLGSGSYFGGDRLVLAASDAREIDRANPPDATRQLMNVVEEMRLASGLPMPRVYVIPDTAPNAFATGRDPKHASVAVTAGLLEKLDREELQGVIAHEFSHVRNFDIRFMLLIGVMVGTIALLADWFLRISFWGGGLGGGRRGSNRDGGGAILAVIAIVALLLSIISPLIGRLVMLAASRRREGLADVSAVDLTRNPLGLARALRKIADDPEVLEVANKATQHLYVVNPIKAYEKRSSSMWDTHPPLAERIQVLEELAGASGALPASSPG
ncbi:MAG: M48 family metallopeptidase [Candidatus Limnocylindria bacterium]